MELKCRTETKVVVEYQDLDKFITKYFRFPREKNFMDRYSPEPEDGVYIQEFEFVAIEEARNDSSYTYSVDGQLDIFEMKEVQEMIEYKTFGTYSTYLILNYLASKDAIPKGEYLIKVCW